ncbi:MAG: hypothetical protein LBL91_01505 [Lachnospiraceae bacterium]|jgi:NAD-dependent dihydropyrimidine dehydrogenase PreA subunit|nr:hypothetical protein [Lachnospiraceae bacterium]
MPVLINYKICDNAKECSGIANCPTGAFAWDEEEKTIKIKEELCIDCGKCACCPVDAIRFAKSKEEYEEIKKEIDEDPRTITDLFIDRYGAAPISDLTMVNENDIEKSLTTKRPVVIELYNQDTIQCLLKSIPIKEILESYNMDSNFAKIEVETDELLNRFGVKELPALLFIKENKLMGKIEGYYLNEDSKDLFSQIETIKML